MPFEVAEELHIEIQNRAGALGEVLKVVADAGVAVRAFCGYGMGKTGHLMLVPSDAAKAKAALKKAKLKFKSSNVVVGTVKDTRGAGAALAAKAAKKKLNLDYAYASGTGKGSGMVVLAAAKGAEALAKALK